MKKKKSDFIGFVIYAWWRSCMLVVNGAAFVDFIVLNSSIYSVLTTWSTCKA